MPPDGAIPTGRTPTAAAAPRQAPVRARPPRRSLAAVLTYVLPVLAVMVIFGLLTTLQTTAQTTLASAASLLPIGYAVAAGMVASVNPCGFFMLPSYVAYHLRTEEDDFMALAVPRRLGRALQLGVAVTLGFVLVFAAIGGLVAAGGVWLVRVFPYASLAIGGAMILLGAWLLVTHRPLGIGAASRLTVTPRRNLSNVFLFGMVYAVCSLSCTLPIFLVVVGSALATQGFGASMGQFLGYALGMGSIVVALTVGAALFRGAVTRWLRGALPHVHRASALFLVGAGAYLVYYWVVYAGIWA